MADTIIAKAIQYNGGLRGFFIDHTGLASYVQAGNAGADSVKVGPGFDKGAVNIYGGIDSSKTYYVFAIPPASSGMPKLSSWTLIWIVIATGVEAAALLDLSGKHVRLHAITL